MQALERYGTGCSGSRFLNGTLAAAPGAGGGAGRISCARTRHRYLLAPASRPTWALSAPWSDRHDYVICDRENHASIYDGCKLSYGKMLRYRHNDMADLEKAAAAVCRSKNGALIVTDGVFSMGGDIAKLPEIVALWPRSTAPGSWWTTPTAWASSGEGGRGTASYFGLEDQVDVYMGTFSKSLASLGGYMAASGGGGGLCAPRFPSVHLLGVHSAGQLRHGPGSPAAPGGASGAAGAAAGR